MVGEFHYHAGNFFFLIFRIFSVDTRFFFSSGSITEIQKQQNIVISKVLWRLWWDKEGKESFVPAIENDTFSRMGKHPQFI